MEHGGSFFWMGELFLKSKDAFVLFSTLSLLALWISYFRRGYTLLVSGTSPRPNHTIKSSKMNNR